VIGSTGPSADSFARQKIKNMFDRVFPIALIALLVVLFVVWAILK
jgi:hypothetical protein